VLHCSSRVRGHRAFSTSYSLRMVSSPLAQLTAGHIGSKGNYASRDATEQIVRRIRMKEQEAHAS
jgi:hypothetical protein